MEDQSLFNNNQPPIISEGLQNFINAMVEEIVIEGKPFDTQKKYLKKFSENEGLDYDKLEGDITTFIEILDSLKTAFSKLQVKLAEEKGKECHVSEEMVKKLVSHSSPKNQKEKPKPVEIKEPEQVRNDDPDKPKKKKVWLWVVGIGAAAVVALLVMFLKPKQEPIPTDPDTQAYEACQVEDSLAQVEARLLVQQQAEAEQAEDEAYGKCTTVAACDSYLNAYPQGRYLENVKAKKVELEAKATQINVSGCASGHDFIDLGLPSGTLWATCNVGAINPEDYGSYFAWGETSTNTYNWSTYKYANGDYNKLTKYCNRSDYGDNGFTDNLTALQGRDDPAASWGSGWHTPSKTQWDELLANTTNKWTTKSGVKGRLFTSKKNGKTLFLPAADNRLDGVVSHPGSFGYYWSRSLNKDCPNNSWMLGFDSYGCHMDWSGRQCSQSVRPVREK